ncbi:MAG: tRNA methyltransferase [Sphingobacteriales bacterium 41-5]|nr:MAG: tRNA methyltransferase [Sphingobacteriales bacterium 41-5]
MLSKAEAKYIQSLSQKKFRQQENLFVAEGLKIIAEALNNPFAKVKKVFAMEDWVRANEKFRSRTEIVTVTEADLNRISQLKTPHGVLALIEIPRSEGFELNTLKLALALDGIQDPGNMGTILRIADWFGVKQIICSNDCADIYNSKVVQASMGSIFRTEVFYTNLAGWLTTQKNTIIYGAALDGIPLRSYKNIQQGVLISGNEGNGIRTEVMQHISQKITIERFGEAESLNAAVATGIILAQIV